MRIGINLFLLQPHVGGIANYVMTLLREWPRLYPEDPLVLLTFEHNEPMLAELPGALRKKEIRLPHQDAILSRLDDFDVFFCPFGSLYPRPIPKPSVALVMDIQERFFPEFFDTAQLRARNYHYIWSLRMADRVVAISDFAKRTFISLVGIPHHRIDRVYLCADELPAEDQRPDLRVDKDAPFAFYPANAWPHKNHRRLFASLRRLRDQGVLIPCVLSGAEMDGGPTLLDLATEQGLGDQVHILGRLTRREIAWLYRHAHLLINPSLFEGFGIPLVEAMTCGLPIACSGTTSLPEIGRDAAVYFNPENMQEMAEVIQQAWEDEKLRQRLVAAGQERVKVFTPQAAMQAQRASFEKALEVYSPARFQMQRLLWKHVSRLWNLWGTPGPFQRARARTLLRRSVVTRQTVRSR